MTTEQQIELGIETAKGLFEIVLNSVKNLSEEKADRIWSKFKNHNYQRKVINQFLQEEFEDTNLIVRERSRSFQFLFIRVTIFQPKPKN